MCHAEATATLAKPLRYATLRMTRQCLRDNNTPCPDRQEPKPSGRNFFTDAFGIIIQRRQLSPIMCNTSRSPRPKCRTLVADDKNFQPNQKSQTHCLALLFHQPHRSIHRSQAIKNAWVHFFCGKHTVLSFFKRATKAASVIPASPYFLS